MPIYIRPATPSDETQFLDLIEQLFDPPGARPPGYVRERGVSGFRWAVEQTNADILLAVDGEALAGLASVYADIESIRYGSRCWLQDLVVSAGRRSGGIGAALLNAAADWGRGHGCTHMELSSGAGRTEAHRFYERGGMSRSFNFQVWLD